MPVIADSIPLHYLVLIDQAAILPTLFRRVLIPPMVAEELQHARTPAPVRAWMSSPPEWLEIRIPHQQPEAVLLRLGAGEREAIVLAQEVQATLLLMDDLEGVRKPCAALFR
jgi:predicted nucleic acid-binding protein